jgi:GNAT superfamily N-acetyltransferase
VEITYTTVDRFGYDETFDLDLRVTQTISGQIIGVYFEEGSTDETHVPLGTIELARIDLREINETMLIDVFDSHSIEWVRYIEVVDRIRKEDDFVLAPAILVLDRAEFVPEARGHGLGLHVLARAIRTWGDDALVVLTAWPPEAVGAEAQAAGEALARYWQRLGLERMVDLDMPILVGRMWDRDPHEIVERLSTWESPASSVV